MVRDCQQSDNPNTPNVIKVDMEVRDIGVLGFPDSRAFFP